MGKWIGPNENTVTILPFTDKGFKFITLDCEEYVCGYIARGIITMVHDGNKDALELITEQETVDIEIGTVKSGTLLKIHGVILNRKYFKNKVSLMFHCIPDIDFYSRRGKLIYTDIDSAIKNLWKGEMEIRTTTDLPSGIELNQAGEFDYKYLGTLCGSYKKNTIYAFGLDGLLIKDLIGVDSTGNNEPYRIVLSNGMQVTQDESNPYDLNYDYKLYMNTNNTWEEDYSSMESKNISTIMFNNKYRLVHKDHSILRENLLNNQKLYFSRMYGRVVVTNTFQLLSYRIGDTVYYKRPGEDDTTPFSTYNISKITYHFRSEPSNGEHDQFPFKQVFTLHCLEEKGVVMNTEDPKAEKTDKNIFSDI